jgi:hypothetical protein
VSDRLNVAIRVYASYRLGHAIYWITHKIQCEAIGRKKQDPVEAQPH